MLSTLLLSRHLCSVLVCSLIPCFLSNCIHIHRILLQNICPVCTSRPGSHCCIYTGPLSPQLVFWFCGMCLFRQILLAWSIHFNVFIHVHNSILMYAYIDVKPAVSIGIGVNMTLRGCSGKRGARFNSACEFYTCFQS